MTAERRRGFGYDPFEGKSPHSGAARLAIEWYLREIRGGLGLCSWEIRVSRGLPAAEVIAETFIRDSADDATVALSEGFFDWPERQRRRTLIHELLHCSLRPLTVAAYDPVEGTLSPSVRDVWRSALDEAEERTVDRLAAALVSKFPRSPDRA
jgi:hypothetical protein